MPTLCRLHRSGSSVSPRGSSLMSRILPRQRSRIVADGAGPVSRTFPASLQDVLEDGQDPRRVGGIPRDRLPGEALPVVPRPGVAESAQECEVDGAVRANRTAELEAFR